MRASKKKEARDEYQWFSSSPDTHMQEETAYANLVMGVMH